ncbi:MAG: single-stranded-DNA-specific exonuclease RecJ, partial [Clostridia bacterium]|nr:single-stranded-DNA-specific exonuclease RecJ [Clostridia bacterium]
MPHVTDCEILAHQEAAPGHYRLVLDAPAIAADALPGQFCMLEVRPGYHPFLRRPMSIERIFPGSVSILYKVEGEGTRLLSGLAPGQSINLQGPLGKPFPLPEGMEIPNGISLKLARLLYARGARTAAQMEAFLHPSDFQFHSPFFFFDMDKAVARIRQAKEKKEQICVYGDYDVDGVCATSIVLGCLQKLGVQAFYHIPSRHTEGYGMHPEAVREIAAAGASLILTVDNGVKAVDEIALAKELGMDVIVTDHHLCGEKLPAAAAILCHTRPEDHYPNPDLCGAGTAYKLAAALLGEEEASAYIPLAGLATMADVVPLMGENRALVALALRRLNDKTCCPGLQALGKLVNEKGRAFTARDLAFGFAPRLNAAGRLEDAGLCVELLCTGDASRAREIACQLDGLNRRRQQEEGAIIAQAAEMIEADDLTERRSIVLKSPDWNPGVVGIAAARIAERYWRPTVLFAQTGELLTGSARSVPGVDIHRALKENEACFLRFGGHAYAAGATMEVGRFAELQEGLERALWKYETAERFLPGIQYEDEVEPGELTLKLAEELALLEPFGQGNPEPAFRTDGVLLRNVRRIGGEGAHLKATAVQNNHYGELVAWGAGYRLQELLDKERCDIIYTPSLNEWNGLRQVQLRVEAFRGTAIKEAPAFLSKRSDKFIDAFSHNILYNSGCALREDTGWEKRLADLW